MLIVLGDAIQQGLTQDDYSLTGAVIVVSTLALLQVFVPYLSYKFKPLRPILEGEPVIIVQDGSVIEKNLRRERVTTGEVEEEMRRQQIESLDKVKWAVLETNGTMTFIKKEGGS